MMQRFVAGDSLVACMAAATKMQLTKAIALYEDYPGMNPETHAALAAVVGADASGKSTEVLSRPEEPDAAAEAAGEGTKALPCISPLRKWRSQVDVAGEVALAAPSQEKDAVVVICSE